MYTYYIAGIPITDELYHDDLESMTFGRRDQNELWHYGIKGQSWGKRRFQEEDGTLTTAGKNRYGVGEGDSNIDIAKNKGFMTDTGSGNAKAGAAAGQRAATATASTPKQPYVSKEYQRELAYNSQKNNFGQSTKTGSSAPQNVRGTVNSGREAADKLFGGISSAVKPSSTQAVNQNGSANQPYVSPEYQREVAYNSQQNVNPEAMQPEQNREQEKQQEKKPGLFDRIGNAASGAFDSAKNWGQQAAKDVGDWGQQAGKDISNAAKDVGNAASNALDSAKNFGQQAAKDVGNLVSNKDELDRLNNVQAGRDKVFDEAVKRSGEYVPDGRGGEDLYIRNEADARAVNALDRQVDAAQRAYDNHPMTRAQNFASNVGNAVGDAANNVGNWGQQAASNVGDFAKKAWESPWVNPVELAKVAGDWYTGQSNADRASELDAQVQRYERMGDGLINRGNSDMDRYSYMDGYGAYPGDNAFSNAENVRRQGEHMHNRAAELGQQADAAMEAYNNAPRQKITNAASSVAQWGAGAVNNGRSAIEKLFGRKK